MDPLCGGGCGRGSGDPGWNPAVPALAAAVASGHQWLQLPSGLPQLLQVETQGTLKFTYDPKPGN